MIWYSASSNAKQIHSCALNGHSCVLIDCDLYFFKERFIMDENTWKLPLDTSAAALSNRVIDEVHSVVSGSSILIYPHWGAYYGDTMTVFSVQANSDINEIYDVVENKTLSIKPMQLDSKLTALTGRNVYKCFSLDLTNFYGYNDFKITYQTPGGDGLYNRNTLDVLKSKLFESAEIDYKLVLGVPKEFDYEDHNERAKLAHGLSELKVRLNAIAQLVDSDNEQHNKMHEYITNYFIERFKENHAYYQNTLTQKSTNGEIYKDNDQKLLAYEYESQAIDLLPKVNADQEKYVKVMQRFDNLNTTYPMYKQVLDWVINYQWWSAAKSLGDNFFKYSFDNNDYYTEPFASLYAFNKFIIFDRDNKKSISITDFNKPFILNSNFTFTSVSDTIYDPSTNSIYACHGYGSPTSSFPPTIIKSTDGITYTRNAFTTISQSTQNSITSLLIHNYDKFVFDCNNVYKGSSFENAINISSIQSLNIDSYLDSASSGTVIAITFFTNNTTPKTRKLYVSFDNGLTFIDKSTGLSNISPDAVSPYGTYKMSIVYDNLTFVQCSYECILVSVDNGVTWVNKASSFTGTNFYQTFYNGSDWIISSNKGIYKANADFSLITLIYSNTNFYVNRCSMVYDGLSRVILSGQSGYCIKSIDNGLTWSNVTTFRYEAHHLSVDTIPTLLDTETIQVNEVKNFLNGRSMFMPTPYNSDTGLALHINSNCAYMTANQVTNNSTLDLTFVTRALAGPPVIPATAINIQSAKDGIIKFSIENPYVNTVKINGTTTTVYTSRDYVLDPTAVFYNKIAPIHAGTIQSSTEGFSLFAVLKYDLRQSFTLLSHIQGNYYIASHPDDGKAIGVYNTSTGKWIAYKYAPFRPKTDTAIGIAYNITLKHLHFYVPDEKFTPEQKCSVDYFDQTELNLITEFNPEVVMPVDITHPLAAKNNTKRIVKQFTLFNKPISIPVFMMAHKKFLYSNYAGINNKNPLIGFAKHAVKFYE